jgi:hypothetical protein
MWNFACGYGKSVLAVEEPMPVATELSVEVRHAEGFVKARAS